MDKLLLSPEEPDFSLTLPLGAIATDAAPAIRVRRYFRNMPSQVKLSWLLMGFQYDYFMSFYRQKILFGAIPFLIDLPTQSNLVSENKALFVNQITVTGQGGLVWAVSGNALVMPND